MVKSDSSAVVENWGMTVGFVIKRYKESQRIPPITDNQGVQENPRAPSMRPHRYFVHEFQSLLTGGAAHNCVTLLAFSVDGMRNLPSALA
jgi:hypothetical protein